MIKRPVGTKKKLETEKRNASRVDEDLKMLNYHRNVNLVKDRTLKFILKMQYFFLFSLVSVYDTKALGALINPLKL